MSLEEAWKSVSLVSPIPGSGKILIVTTNDQDLKVFDTDAGDIVPEETIPSPLHGRILHCPKSLKLEFN